MAAAPPPPLDEESLAACAAALLQPYEATVQRVQALLQELREAQEASAGALASSRDALALSEASEALAHAVGFVPVYCARAAAAAKEMRALRARLDYAMERAALLKHSALTGAPLVPKDLGAYAEAAAELTASLKSSLGSLLYAPRMGGGGAAPP